ncbi:MAG: AbrB/MazE/SpoVT family DNA-binding domain-containing protein [Pseudomonadales bacterium]
MWQYSEWFMRTQVRRIGNSLGNIIPAAVIKQLGLVEGSELEVKAQGNKIIIEAVGPNRQRLPFSEDELLQGLDAGSAHANELATLTNGEFGD